MASLWQEREMTTPLELNRKVFQALIVALGYVDAIRFFKQFDDGGDYTKERHQWLDSLSLDDIWAEMQQRQTSHQES